MKVAIWTVVAATAIAAGLLMMIATGSLRSDPAIVQYRELRDLTGFTDIVLGGEIELEITQGEVFLVEIEATADALSGLHTLVDGATLDIHLGSGSDGFFGLFAPDYKVRVTLPELKSLMVQGGAEVDGTNAFTGERLAVVSAGGSEVDLTVAVSSIAIETSDGSDIDLIGTAETATIHVNGGSDFSGIDFVAKDVSVEISGGSESSLTVADRLTGSVSGGSDLVYQGNPATTDVRSSGGAGVTRL